MITQVFVLGASSSYGVGSSVAGWGDLIKQHLHDKMYKSGGLGETYEVFNFGKSGATIDFVQQTFPWQLEHYGRGGKVIVVVAVGGNNMKAAAQPDNFVSTPDEYRQQIRDLLTMIKSKTESIIFTGGNAYVDESKTNPKPDPLSGGVDYFTNARRRQFLELAKQVCSELGVAYVDVAIDQDTWLASYLYDDGLHPNQAGHQLIFEAIKPSLDKEL